jgi:ring-1,2-phenylacetyl-CoA epoxidase subunit PaaC
LGRALSEWAVGAPTLENAVGCAAIAQEELGHCRALYPLLNELPWEGGPTPLEHEGDRDRLYCVSFLDQSPSTWPEMVAGLLLIDSATLTLIESLLGSGYGNLARRLSRMPAEERFHLEFAEGRVREIGTFPDGLSQLSSQVDRLLPEMLCWFGPPGERGVNVLVDEGLMRSDSSEMRQAYLARVSPLLLEMRIDLPVRWDLATMQWECEELPWKKWNGLQRRLDGIASTTS